MLLSYEIDGKYLRNLCCKVCAENEQRIKGMNYFSRTWFSARTNYRPSAANDLAEYKAHKEAMKMHQSKNNFTHLKDKKAGSQINIKAAFSFLDERVQTDLIRKF